MSTDKITKEEKKSLQAVGYSIATIDGWLAHWTREDIIEFVSDDNPEVFNPVGVKKGLVHCPICNEQKWNKSLNEHIFKVHADKLIEPYMRDWNKDKPVISIVVPLNITTPIFDNDTNEIVAEPSMNTEADIHDPITGHGQADKYFNQKTGRMKLIERKRPEKFDIPILYFCLCCRKAWTSKKSATKHFLKADGTATDCANNQLRKLNTMRGLLDVQTKVTINLPNQSAMKALNKDVQVLELQHENASLKKKLSAHVDIGIKKDNEILRLKALVEKLEGMVEAEPACCPACLKRDVKENSGK